MRIALHVSPKVSTGQLFIVICILTPFVFCAQSSGPANKWYREQTLITKTLTEFQNQFALLTMKQQKLTVFPTILKTSKVIRVVVTFLKRRESWEDLVF